MASFCKLSRHRSADARTKDYKSPGRRIDSAPAKVLFFKVFSFLSCYGATFCRFLASVCKVQFCICVKIGIDFLSVFRKSFPQVCSVLVFRFVRG